MLNVALVDAVRATALPPQLERPIDRENDEEIFQAVVNKLCHVCDSDKGGSTVTSFFILQGQNVVHYWFASNRRTTEELEDTALFVGRLLRKVGQAPGQADWKEMILKDLLVDIARFNRNRIAIYLKTLPSRIEDCLQKCEEEDANEGNSPTMPQP